MAQFSQFETVFQNASADASKDLGSMPQRKNMVLVSWGSFDGASITLQSSVDCNTWSDLTTIAGEGIEHIYVPSGSTRAVISSAGGSTALNVVMFRDASLYS